MTTRVIWPYFMVWSRNAKRSIIVQLNAMRCARLGHKHLIAKWVDSLKRHVAFCVECESVLPDVVVRDEFYREPIPLEV